MEPTTPPELRIAAALITKDSTATIREALASVRPFVDHVFVYDTGSTDGTVELLESMNHDAPLWADPQTGIVVDPTVERDQDAPPLVEVPLAPITVQKGEWRDDFAWARQQSWNMIPTDEFGWALWLDDDDVVQGAQWLRPLIMQAHPACDGFIFQYDYARDESGACVCVLWRERLLRLSAGYYWLNPVHEVLVPPGRPAALAMVPAEQIRYIHNRPPERYSPDRNLKILQRQRTLDLENGEPTSPRTLAYLGTELMAKGDFVGAIPYLHEYLQHPDAGIGDERSQVHHKLAICLRVIGNPMGAVEAEMMGLRERDDWSETYIGLAQAFEQLGQYDRAIREAHRALELGVPRTALIVNPLEFTLLPWITIANSCVQLGRGDQAKAAMQQALAAAPDNPQVKARAAEIEALVARSEIEQAVHHLREVLVRHDENLKAYMLMEHAVPYVVEEQPGIVKARADQREMVAHYLRPEEYERWYRDEPKESTVPDEHVENIGQYIPRAQRLLEGLLEQEKQLGRKPRLLDLGSNDMWMGCFLWKSAGIHVDGVELNRQSVEKGLKRMETFGAPGKLLHGNLYDAPLLTKGRKYDAVSLFEVLEHVPDVEKTLDLMESLLKPGGTIYISTPNGAYERGLIDGWANVERKGHLRAIPVHELVDRFQARGVVQTVELQHGDRVTFASYTPAPRKSRVVLYAGAGWEPWSPASIRTTGLGGSETALVQVAMRLADRGHHVTVYSGAETGFYGGAMFRPFTAWDPTDDPDLLIVSRVAHVFDNPIGAKKTALWCHDHSYPGVLTEERSAGIDHVVVLSEWQKERFARLYPFLQDRLTLIRNGISETSLDGSESRYPDRDRPFAERAPRVVYSSSADRGLDVLLQVWPRIRESVPDAELHVFYGWDVFDRVAATNPGLLGYKQHVLQLVDAAGGEQGGVFMRGRVGQQVLAEEMQNARVWGYPGWFLETSCIGAMEARAAGLPIVCSDLGALKETVGEHGLLLPWGPDEDVRCNETPEYQDRFVKAVVDRLTDEQVWTHWHREAITNVHGLDWSYRIVEWEQLIPTRKTGKQKRSSRAKAKK